MVLRWIQTQKGVLAAPILDNVEPDSIAWIAHSVGDSIVTACAMVFPCPAIALLLISAKSTKMRLTITALVPFRPPPTIAFSATASRVLALRGVSGRVLTAMPRAGLALARVVPTRLVNAANGEEEEL